MKKRQFFLTLFSFVVLLFTTNEAFAHCDSMKGPVVKAAQKALETADVNLVLIWVRAEEEAEIKSAFEKTLKVRKLTPEAKQLADLYFFETLVRVHRAGEGAPYTGLKSGTDEVEPGIRVADQAIEQGNITHLVESLTNNVHQTALEKFNELKEKKNFNSTDVHAGREYVKSYVEFVHFVERLHQAIEPGGTHAPDHHNQRPAHQH